VHGNMDTAELCRLLPSERVVEAGGARIAMVHDAGPRTGRLERMRRRFGERADAVVFGPSSSATHTSRFTSGPETASRSSTPAARRSAAARPRTQWGWPERTTERSSSSSSS
jgi:hypothetical protein